MRTRYWFAPIAGLLTASAWLALFLWRSHKSCSGK